MPRKSGSQIPVWQYSIGTRTANGPPVSDSVLPSSDKRTNVRWHNSRKWVVLACLQTVVVCILGVPPGGAQTKAPLAEQVFRDVQLLKGIPVDEFMETMGF